MSKRNLDGKRVLLTGASSGIGWYLAQELVQAGASVVVTARRHERLKQLVETLPSGARCKAVAGDICDPAHRQSLVDESVKHLGGLDLLINNAGVGAIGSFQTASPERARKLFEINFFAAVELSRLALKHLQLGNQPAICLINSVLGYRGVPEKSEYCATKFALRGWSESLRVELKPVGIDVLSMAPSTTDSEFFQSLLDTRPGAQSRSLGKQSPRYVAKKIIQAIRKGRAETVLSFGGRFLVWGSRFCPRITEYVLTKLN